MDKETRDAFANLSAVLAIIARRQTEQGEALARIVGLLTAEPEAQEGPSLPEMIAELLATIQGQGTCQGDYLKRILGVVTEARRDLPLETVRAIDDNLGPLAKAAA